LLIFDAVALVYVSSKEVISKCMKSTAMLATNYKVVPLRKKYSKIIDMEKVVITMSLSEYKKKLAFKEVNKVVQSIKGGLKEVKEAREDKRTLKSAHQLANEL
jgi:hypothetical protein